MKLEKLLEGILIDVKKGNLDTEVKSLTYDSRKVEKVHALYVLQDLRATDMII